MLAQFYYLSIKPNKFGKGILLFKWIFFFSIMTSLLLPAASVSEMLCIVRSEMTDIFSWGELDVKHSDLGIKEPLLFKETFKVIFKWTLTKLPSLYSHEILSSFITLIYKEIFNSCTACSVKIPRKAKANLG